MGLDVRIRRLDRPVLSITSQRQTRRPNAAKRRADENAEMHSQRQHSQEQVRTLDLERNVRGKLGCQLSERKACKHTARLQKNENVSCA